MRLTVHHLGISQSERIVWLCEELGIPYDLKRYDRDPMTKHAPPEYKALHPMGIAPVITDGDLVLAESGAIIEYLLAKNTHDLAVPPDAPFFPDYLFWLHFGNGTLMPGEMSALLARSSDSSLISFFRERADRAFSLVEDRLGDVPYLAGETFTAADIICVFPLTTMRAFSGRSLDKTPNVQRYLARIGGRPAYRRAMAKGDPGFTPMLS